MRSKKINEWGMMRCSCGRAEGDSLAERDIQAAGGILAVERSWIVEADMTDLVDMFPLDIVEHLKCNTTFCKSR